MKINSPSHLFMGFGSNIGEGASIGILQSLPGMKSAMAKLSGLGLVSAAVLPVLAAASVAGAWGNTSGAGTGAMTAGHQAAVAGRGQLVFSPTINLTVAAGSSDVRGQVQQALRLSLAEFERLLRDYHARQNRTRAGGIFYVWQKKSRE